MQSKIKLKYYYKKKKTVGAKLNYTENSFPNSFSYRKEEMLFKLSPFLETLSKNDFNWILITK